MKELLSKMTLTEKVGQLNQRLYGWELYTKENGHLELTDTFKDEVKRFGGLGAIYGLYRSDPWSGKNLETGLSAEEGKRLIEMVNTYIKDNTRLGIPPLLSEETPHGIQSLDSTTLPSNISVGQTWNPELVEKVQEVVGYESAIRGVHFALISCLDVMRDPRWGRSEECFSEDPYLTKIYAKHSILGLQKYPLLAVAKHFAAQGSGYGGLNAAPSSIGERELREIHAPGLQGVVEAEGRMMMAAYNEIDGILCHDNPWLLRTFAKDEMGYKGGYMADGVALDRLAYLAGSPKHAAARGLEAGVDLSLWDDVYPYLEDAVREGLVSEALLDESVLRVLEMKHDLGLFDASSPKINKPNYKVVDQLTEESFVLLKNTGLLPLDRNKKIAVIGPNAHALYNQCGDYTPYKDFTKGSTIYEGIASRMNATYAQGSEITELIPNGYEDALNIANDADVILVVFGGSSARDFNTKFDANGAAISGSNNMTCGENIDVADLNYPHVQIDLIHKLKALNKPMIGLAIQGRPHTMDGVSDCFDALFAGGYPGQHGGKAFAKVLVGDVNPSGKLAMSIPKTAFHQPSYYNYKLSYQNPKYIDLNPVSDFGFGHGLSYSEFKLDDVTISTLNIAEETKEVIVSGTITNISDRDGAEVIQIYMHHEHSSVIQRVKQLVGFKKVHLKAKESQSFEISVSYDQFLIWSAQRKYALEPGSTHIIIETTEGNKTFKLKRIIKETTEE